MHPSVTYDPTYLCKNFNLQSFVLSLFIWFDHICSQMYDIFGMLVTYFRIFIASDKMFSVDKGHK